MRGWVPARPAPGGLDEILTPAGFAPVTWESIVIDLSGTPEQVWQASLSLFYDVVVLTADQLTQLHRAFLSDSSSLQVDDHLTCGMRINIATTRLFRAVAESGEVGPITSSAESRLRGPQLGR